MSRRPAPRAQSEAVATTLAASAAQTRLWFLAELEPDSAEYNLGLRLRLLGELSAHALRNAFAALIVRHEALRSSLYGVADAVFRQIMSRDEVPELSLVDLSDLEPGARTTEAERIGRELAATPFALSKAPLWRAALLRLDHDRHELIFVVHHAVFDGWSVGIFVEELVALYRAALTGTDPALPPLAEIEQAEPTDDHEAADLEWWVDALRGAPQVLDLPFDRPRPAVPTSAGGRVPLALGIEQARELRQLAQDERATEFMALLAGFATLLHRYADQDDLIVGTPVAGRPTAELQRHIGFFVNTLVIRATFEDDPSFREVLRRVRSSAIEAFSRPSARFERLVELLQEGRDRARHPLFQAMFTFDTTVAQQFAAPGLSIELDELETGTAMFDLSLSLRRDPAQIAGYVEYSAELFDHGTIVRLVEHFRRLLVAAAAAPDTPVSALDLLSTSERRLVLRRWNDTRVTRPFESVQGLVRASARRGGAAVAVAGPDGTTLTYDTLVRRAQALAGRLHAQRVERGDHVGVLLERGAELVVSLLGVLWARAAYVPLDPDYPVERLRLMVEDSGARVVLTTRDLTSKVPGSDELALCFVEDLSDDEYPTAELDDVAPEDTAYVIYTSGSTGRPKGVSVPHRALANLVQAMAERPGFGEADVLAAVTPVSFDISGLEFFLPLVAGGRVAVLSRDEATDGGRLWQALEGHQASVMQATPATWQLLLGAGWPGSRRLRALVGGEALPPALVQRLLPRVAGLWNMYGPTETTIWSTCGEVRNPGAVTIGTPIANTQAYVLDRRLQPVPIGVAGRLFLGGDGLAHGYHRRSGSTAQAFIPNPFAREGARLYETGDVARFRDDGRIVFLGRRDAQVKLRGFRIETREVESALAEHPAVSEAAVVLQGEGLEDRRLTAFVVVEPDAREPKPEELRDLLTTRLPSYMVPSRFVTLERLPRTPAGKTARAALARLELSPERRDAPDGRPARDALEYRLVTIWEEILDRSPIAVDESFFDLGGHSLLGLRLVSRVQELTGRKLPLAALFEGPTIEQLAARIRRGDSGRPRSLVAIQPRGDRPPFLCVHPVGGNVFWYAPLARELGERQPFYGLQARGLDPSRPPDRTIEEMARAYLDEVRELRPEGPYMFGGWSFGSFVAYEMARLAEAAGEDVSLLALFDSATDDRLHEHPDGALHRLVHALALDDLEASILEQTPELRLPAMLDLALEAGTLPPGFSLNELERMYELNAINLSAMNAYGLGPFPGRVTLFKAGVPSPGESPVRATPTMGWDEYAAEVEVVPVPGDHFDFLGPRHLPAFAARLAAQLARAGAAHATAAS